MIIKTVNLETVVGVTSKLPHHTWPEFAFAGKSNVGKSTLINGLMNRKSLARTSAKPGKTQTINYYNVNDTFYLVDLPGYGYTTAAVHVRAQWGKMIENYLQNSKSLRCVFLLVDIRHAPSADDRQMFDWIVHAGFTPVVIATKADKIKRSQLEKQKKLIRDTLWENCAYQVMLEERAEEIAAAAGKEKTTGKNAFPILPYAGLTREGRDAIYAVLEELL